MKDAVLQAFQQLRMAVPDSAWGGVGWVSPSTLVAMTTPTTPKARLAAAVAAARAQGAKVELRRGTHSLVQLTRLQDRVWSRLPADVECQVSGVTIDTVTNRVVIGLNQPSARARWTIARVLGPAYEVTQMAYHHFDGSLT